MRVLGLALLQALAHRAEPAQVDQALFDRVRSSAAAGTGRRPPPTSAERTALASGSSTCAPASAAANAAQRAAQQRQPTSRRRRAPGPCSHGASTCRRFAERAQRHRRRPPCWQLASRRPWILDLAFFQAALGDHDAMRHADQLPVGEHRAGALAAVVEHHVDAKRRELIVQVRRRRARTSSLRS